MCDFLALVIIEMVLCPECLCSSQDPHAEGLAPNAMGFGTWTFRKLLGQDGEILITVSCLYKKRHQN